MWRLTFRKTFFHDLQKVPPKLQTKIRNTLSLPIFDPFSIPQLKKLQGHPGKYRIRFGDFRVGLEIDHEAHVIHIMRVGHRREFYRSFP